MEPVKVIIFVATFVLLLLLGRKLSGSGNAYIVPPFEGQPQPVQDTTISAIEEPAATRPSCLVGADLPFPIHLPGIERNQDGRYNRPEFENYYFEDIDLKTGPVDPTAFCDELYIVARDVESNNSAYYKYLVATPAGLQAAMAAERLPALYIDDQTIIVSRWDLPLILGTATKQIMRAYAEPRDGETNALPAEDA